MPAHAVDARSMPREEVLEALNVIAGGLRQDDLNEALAATGGDPRDILRQSFDLSSHVWFIMDRDGIPIAVFGAAPSAVAGVGVVWLMATDGVEREWVAVARQTRRYLKVMHESYPTLWNFIDARNELSLDWLLWSGFHLIDASSTYGQGGQLFYEFARVG